jgi:hypothetical protein
MTKTILFLGMSSISALLFGCGGDDEVPENPIPSEIEIEGTWASNFGSVETIDSTSWTITSSSSGEGGAGGEAGEPFPPTVSRIEEFSNDSNEVVTQNPEDAAFSPGLYNRIVWTEIEGKSFFYCTTDFGIESSAAAQALNTHADASDPENSGCGDFPWTKLTRQ